jgi:DNA-binding transcriptional LysR family regulator
MDGPPLGERFLLRAKHALEELVAASEVARELGQRPAGLLRLSAPRAVVPILLEPLIASFCRTYPEIEVEIAASAELVDLATPARCSMARSRMPSRVAGSGASSTACISSRRR